MSMNSGQYEENTFTPVVNAMELSDYVFLITDNPNKFPEYTVTKKKSKNMQPLEIKTPAICRRSLHFVNQKKNSLLLFGGKSCPTIQ